MIIIIMGVSGSGKTTIGKGVAERLSLPFHDADLHHSTVNIDKMASGKPLTDADRFSWLIRLNILMKQLSLEGGAVLACSALKESYRSILVSEILHVEWVYLKVSKEILKARLLQRTDHFMKIELLDSQIEILQPPKYGLHIDITETLEDIIASISNKFL